MCGILKETMDTPLRERVRNSIESARSARQFADRCIRRAEVLVAGAALLLERFDHIEQRHLRKTTNNDYRREHRTAQGDCS
jgi:hypothetical protein